MNEENISPAIDYSNFVTKKDLADWRAKTIADLQQILQGFQRDMIGGQQRLNLAWNAMNAVIQALEDNHLFSEDDLVAAGRRLMKEAQQNIETTKSAVEAGKMPDRNTIKPVPIERVLTAALPKPEPVQVIKSEEPK